MKKYSLVFFTLVTLNFSIPGFAKNAASITETTESQQCCAPHGISYCDLSAGHYVCNDGGYSACICQETTSVTAKKELMLGCCTWHGGIIKSEFGEVICADGSRSEVCSIQSMTVSGLQTQ